MKSQVLFVDDEPNIILGLRRMLYGLRNEWDMHFAGSGAEALDSLAQKPIDIVVTDMRMPQMDGAQLLEQVRERYPHVIRMVLTGQCDEESAYSVVTSSHQFMAKPCDSDILAGSVRRALSLRNLLSDENVRREITNLSSLPSPSDVCQELIRELNAAEPSFKTVGELIEGDIAMSAKIMQLANSSYFGLSQNVNTPMQALNMLGLETVSALALTHGIISQMQGQGIPDAVFRNVTAHSLMCSRIAQGIAKLEDFENREVSYAFIGALLHDVGILGLVSGLGETYQDIVREAKDRQCKVSVLEQERLGCTHATVGAYLLSLWGFPGTVVDAVAFHHTPEESHGTQIDVLTAIHVAEAMVHCREIGDDAGSFEDSLDTGYLKQVNAHNKVDEWRAKLNHFTNPAARA